MNENYLNTESEHHFKVCPNRTCHMCGKEYVRCHQWLRSDYVGKGKRKNRFFYICNECLSRLWDKTTGRIRKFFDEDNTMTDDYQLNVDITSIKL